MSEFEFYATPDEQQEWLARLMSDGSVWCVLRETPPNPRVEYHTNHEVLNSLSFLHPGRGMTQLFFGLRGICEHPMWEEPVRGNREISFTKSQAISYNPSLVAAGSILIEGHMGIMREVYYREAGIDARPVQKWFRHVVDSFRTLHASNAKLIHRGPSGRITAYPKVTVTQGAIEWYKSGRKLKQFVDGNVEFDLQLTD